MLFRHLKCLVSHLKWLFILFQYLKSIENRLRIETEKPGTVSRLIRTLYDHGFGVDVRPA